MSEIEFLEFCTMSEMNLLEFCTTSEVVIRREMMYATGELLVTPRPPDVKLSQ